MTVAPDDATGPHLLEVDHLEVCYGEAIAVSDVSLWIDDGEVVSVLGANGAGKSSLAAAIAGVVTPSGGSVLLDGVDTTGWPSYRMSASGVVYVPEGRGIFPNLTVIDNLRAMLRWSLPSIKRSAALERAFEMFPVLDERRRQQAGTLSGGEQQMLGLARVLVGEPKVVIADELSMGLAPMMVDAVFDALHRAREAGVTIMLVEQYVDRALELADRAVLMRNGVVAWTGPSGEAHDEWVAGYMGTGD